MVIVPLVLNHGRMWRSVTNIAPWPTLPQEKNPVFFEYVTAWAPQTL